MAANIASSTATLRKVTNWGISNSVTADAVLRLEFLLGRGKESFAGQLQVLPTPTNDLSVVIPRARFRVARLISSKYGTTRIQ